MKSLSYILLTFLLMAASGCTGTDDPYVGYISIDYAVVDAAGGSTTITANTDISGAMSFEMDEETAEWCTVSSKGKEITVTATKANPNADVRKANIKVKCGYRATTFTVLQKYENQTYLELDWGLWTATGSAVQASDGGGYPSLFKDNRTNFWHSQYSPATPLPHWIKIDMKKEESVDMVRIGRRQAGVNNYPSVKTMEIYASKDDKDYVLAGQFTFALPWTAPDGTVVNGNSPLIPGYEQVVLDAPVTARYMKLVITATNNTNGTCQVAYFKPHKKIK